MANERYAELINAAKSVLKVYSDYEPYFSYFDKISDIELDNINMVINNLHFKCNKIHDDEVSFDDVLAGAIETFRFFSSDVMGIFEQVLGIIDFKSDSKAEISDYVALTTHTISSEKSINRYTMRIVLPQKFERCSKYFLSHEFVHAVKDINYDEMKLLFTSIETIPILWEFIQSYLDGDDFVMSRVFSERYYQMLHIEKLYNDSNIFLDRYSKGLLKCGDKLARAVQLVNMESKMYLNSFYYAVSIFEKFLKNKSLVLNYLNQVLANFITTKQFISLCSQSVFDDGADYIKGFKNFKDIANNSFRK